MSLVLVAQHRDGVVVVADRGGVVWRGGVLPVLEPFSKIRVSTGGLVIAAVGKGTVSRPDGSVVDLLQVAVDAAGPYSRPARAAVAAREALEELASMVREQVGLGEFVVNGDGTPTISSVAVIGHGSHVELVHLTTEGPCDHRVRVPPLALGPPEFVDAAERAAQRAAKATSLSTAQQTMIEALDAPSRSRPFVVSRDWESLTLTPGKVEHRAGSLEPVKLDIPRH